MKTKLLLALTFGFACAGPAWAAPTLARTSPGTVTYVDQTDFDVMDYSAVGDVTASVSFVDFSSGNSGCEAADFAGFAAGNIALLQRGGCTYFLKATNAYAAGAAGVLISNNVAGLLQGNLTESYAALIPVMGLTQALGLELANTAGLSMRMSVDVTPVPASVPEPGALALIGLGLVGISALRRRNRVA